MEGCIHQQGGAACQWCLPSSPLTLFSFPFAGFLSRYLTSKVFMTCSILYEKPPSYHSSLLHFQWVPSCPMTLQSITLQSWWFQGWAAVKESSADLSVSVQVYDRLLITSWGHDPGVVPTSNVLTMLNDALTHSAVLIQVNTKTHTHTHTHAPVL